MDETPNRQLDSNDRTFPGPRDRITRIIQEGRRTHGTANLARRRLRECLVKRRPN